MSSFASDFSQAGPARDYASNVGTTARAFLAALFAVDVRPSSSAEPSKEAPISARKRANNLMQLHRMADQYESTMPGMASELRCIAARG